ncbi:AraC family transcriptional regulator [Pseudomonas cavernae]|uniref:AraC family transcriptional regulator n=1 Tax=Pseudomonas cavernae TaxID=2320867 RepID=A0A385Z0D0_9PSED|nr:AraC family transcriptional regulator [Pseudomonas cavernae]AYC31052.1 AraC family transcriptional regulator [Pseudomonas cavernae]
MSSSFDPLPGDSPLTHSATLRRLLYEALAELRLDPTEIYRRIYQHRRIAVSPIDERLEHDSAPLFWQALPEISGDADIGLHLGEAMKPRLLDVVGYLLLASRDLRQAVDSFVRFQHIVSGGLVAQLQVTGDEACLVIDLNYLGVASLRQQMECVALLTLKLLAFVSDDEFRLTGLHFRHAQPRQLREHRRLFGLQPEFGQPHDALLFPAALLQRPSRTANPGLHALLSEHAQRQLDGLVENQLLNRLRYLLGVRLGGGDCTLAACARELGLSVGMLQRALAAQGYSLRQVREAVRRDRATELLRGGGSIREVARACGFAELSPFYRAFRRWHGETPEQHRLRVREA